MLDPIARKLLDQHIRDTHFYHYDGWDSDPLDEHSGHPILSRHSSVLLNLDKHGEFVISHLQSIGVCAENIYHVRTDSLVGDHEISEYLAQQSPRGGAARKRFSYFYAFYHQDLLPLNSTPESVMLAVSPQRQAFDKWNSKSRALDGLKLLGVKSPEAVSIATHADAAYFIGLDPESSCILKHSSQVPELVKTLEEVQEVWDEWQSSMVSQILDDVILERHIDTGPVMRTPNLTWLVPADRNAEPIFLFATDQILKPGTLNHMGNVMPSALSPDLLQKCKDAAAPILDDVRGIDSVIGIDYVFDVSDEVYVVDVNPRFNSCSFPGDAFSRLTDGRPDMVAVYTKIVAPREKFTNLSSLLEKLGDQIELFSKAAGCGIVAFGPMGHEYIDAFRVLSVGKSRGDSDKYIDQLRVALSD